MNFYYMTFNVICDYFSKSFYYLRHIDLVRVEPQLIFYRNENEAVRG